MRYALCCLSYRFGGEDTMAGNASVGTGSLAVQILGVRR